MLLRAGFAGEPVRRGQALLYDALAVGALAHRGGIDWVAFFAEVPRGLAVQRLADELPVHLAQSWDERTTLVSRQPAMPPAGRMLVSAEARADGSKPWVATLCGFVVHAADLTGVSAAEDGSTVLRLDPPGPWHRLVDRRRLWTGPGRPWTFVDPPTRCERTVPPLQQ